MGPAVVSACIAGVFSVICTLIARSPGPPRPPAVPTLETGLNVSLAQAQVTASLPWSPARWLSWVCTLAWIIPGLGIPFGLTALGFAIRDRKPNGRRVPGYSLPIIWVSLVLSGINFILGAVQAAHGCQFWQPAAGCHQ